MELFIFLQNGNKYLALEWEAYKVYINVKIYILIITRASNFRTLDNGWYLRNVNITTLLVIMTYYDLLASIFDHGTGCT